MLEKVLFSQLWDIEESYLYSTARQLKPRSVIVDIGAAQGGSSYIFSHATENQCQIFSYDIVISETAKKNLAGRDVKLISLPSVEGANRWNEMCGKPVDLLFIDGSHLYADVVGDFLAWLPHVSGDARILFHDYDPIDRGGVVHLGVQLLIDSLKHLSLVRDSEHIGRVYSCRIRCVPKANELLEAASLVWSKKIEKTGQIPRLLEESDVVVASESNRYSQFLLSMSLLDERKISREWRDGGCKAVFLPQILSEQNRKRVIDCEAALIDEFTLRYLAQHMLFENRELFVSGVKDRNLFFKYEELLDILNSACESGRNMDAVFNARTESLADLSSFVSREMLRLYFIDSIIRSF